MTLSKEDDIQVPASGTAYQPLDEAVATPLDTAGIPSATAVPMVEVIAPSTLAEGYTFEATSNGQTFTVVVPSGGVQEGQRFLAPITNPSTTGVATTPGLEVPTGRWKDGLCDCCRLGCCHALLCLAIWCEPIAIAQVMTRMRLDWCGKDMSTEGGARSNTFRNVLFVFFGYIVLDATLQSLYNSYTPEYQDDDNFDPYANLPTVCVVAYVLDWILEVCFGLYILCLLVMTRRFIRAKYDIPEQRCVGCEDVCCSFWCGLCTLTQMARHTADYDTYAAVCCTETGLPTHVPATLV